MASWGVGACETTLAGVGGVVVGTGDTGVIGGGTGEGGRAVGSGPAPNPQP